MIIKDQGVGAENLFQGKSTSRIAQFFYSESADLFAKAIKDHLASGSYKLADLGGYKGEFLKEIITKLPEYTFDSTIIDTNDGIISDVNAKKIQGNIINTPFENKSVDVSILRYVLAWNSPEHQVEVLKEVARITKGIAIIQHHGSESDNPLPIQHALDNLFDGRIPQLKREDYLFSSPSQVETVFKNLNINFKKIQERKIEHVSELFIEKYRLIGEQADLVRATLAGCDYLMQVSWVLDFTG